MRRWGSQCDVLLFLSPTATDRGLDKLGIIPSARGVQFVKRDDEGKLAGLFVATPTHPRCLAAAASGSHALSVEGPSASSMGSITCSVGDAEA